MHVGCGRSALLLLSLVSECSLMLFIQLHIGLLGAVLCFVSAAPVHVGCFVPLPAAWGLVRVGCFRSVLLVRARGPALWLGVCLLGFPAVACAVTPIPTIASLCNKCTVGTYALHAHDQRGCRNSVAVAGVLMR